MGKRIIQQRRGRGTSTYRAPSFRYKGKVKHVAGDYTAMVADLIHCPGHSAPLMAISTPNGFALSFAPIGIKVGDEITVGEGAEPNLGNVLSLKDIPEGTMVHNIELRPGDGGKLVRSSGSAAKVMAKTDTHVRILLPSKKEKTFLANCRAAIGVLAGSGRLDKPFLKQEPNSKRCVLVINYIQKYVVYR